jgi:hypothetical protein
MKSITTKRTAALLVCAALAAALAGCKSGPEQKTDVLDDKGASFDIPTPAWLSAYITGGNHAVEALPEYANEHCFVVDFINPDRDYAILWVNHANGSGVVAEMISTTVHNDAMGRIGGATGDGVTSNMEAVRKAYSDASFTGLQRMADWWQITRNRSTKTEECRAFALYTVDRDRMDTQIAANLQNIIDNNEALSAAARSIYLDIIMAIRSNGFTNSRKPDPRRN